MPRWTGYLFSYFAAVGGSFPQSVWRSQERSTRPTRSRCLPSKNSLISTPRDPFLIRLFMRADSCRSRRVSGTSSASRVITNSNLQWFSGEDILNLPLLTIGAVGCVSVVGHVAADRIKQMMSLYFDKDVAGATKMHKELTPVYYGVMGNMPGVMSVKAYLKLKGLPGGDPRLPLVAADKDQTEKLVTSLRAGGVQI